MPRWEFLNKRKDPLPPPSKDHGQPPPTPWRPFYLRRLVITCFIFATCAIVAALEVLNHISQSQNGLASSVERLHYVWTYTPTAILTIISALWARTEFQAKQNAPWRSLQQPEEVDKSLLLDYDNIPPVALWKSLKHRHFIVAAGIACSLLLQLAILFSTSLLSLQRVHVQKLNVPIQLADIFDGNNPAFNDTTLKVKAFDTLNQVQFENLIYPSGTNANLAFQSFSNPSASGVSAIHAPIRAMEADLECEHATLVVDQWEVARSNDTWGGNTFDFLNNRITTPSCTIFNLTGLDNFSTKGWNPYKAMMYSVTCENSTDTDRSRILVFATHYHLGRMLENHTSHPSTFWTHRYEIVLDNSVQMFCKPRFSLVNMEATSNLSQLETAPVLKRIGTEKPDFTNPTAWDISDQVMQGSAWGNAVNRPIAAHPAFLDNDIEPPEVDIDSSIQPQVPIDYTIQLGTWIAGKTGSAQVLLQDGVLEEVASTFYRSMAAQVIHGGLRKQKVTQTNGSIIVEDNRVLVMQSPLRVLEVCLVISALIAVAMVLLRPNDGNLSQNPSNISTIANIMSNSQILRRSLGGTGASTLEVLKERTSENKYFLRNHRQGASIEADGDESYVNSRGKYATQNSGCTRQPNLFWKPFPNIWSRIPIFCVITGVIIALETLLHISQKNHGLGKASDNGTIHYLWTTVPSLVMMVIGLSIGSLESNARILAPYVGLQKAQGIDFDVLATNFLDALRITNLFRAVRTGNFAVFSSTLATLVASFLTIVTSGLFSAVEVPQILNSNFTQETLFKSPNVSALLADTPAFITADYILNDNLSYPEWTFEDLVFPELSFPEYSDWTANEDLYADVRIPAIRGSSDCTFATGKALNYTLKSLKGEFPGFSTYTSQGLADGSGGPWLSLFNIHFYPPNHDCPVPGANSTFLTNDDAYYNIDFPEDGYFGQTFPIFCFGTGEATQSRLTMYVWGYFENLTMHHISSMTCAGKIESVDTITRFKLPGFDIPSDHPPIPDESSVNPLPHFNGVWDIYNLDTLTSYYIDKDLTKEDIRIDNVFSSLLNGRYKVPKEFLREPQYDAKVREAIKRQERIVRAQPLKAYARLAANGTLDNKPISGNLTVPKNLRVQQDEISTRVLEVMLGLVLIFGILGSVLMNTDHVLPKNPMSIAAVGSLLADSNFLHLYRFTEQNPNYRLLRGCRVHLGWLGDESSSEGSSDPDESKEGLYFTIYMKTDKTEKTEKAGEDSRIGELRSNSLQQDRANSGEGAWI
ncbi:hypothetical protein N7481_009638 [Penicillium waksmanii]|uniref:uncharacterized protein n=1 Tax=Penicillium waksmanii TaxID=69791 RepID=UPI0025495F4E|nr:uncharacterized protein N7481_009638 [Penicillium waksmanii]KAJ5975931.1 hypothetical protein N7481_009638 [Penicillium waksmanii]